MSERHGSIKQETINIYNWINGEAEEKQYVLYSDHLAEIKTRDERIKELEEKLSEQTQCETWEVYVNATRNLKKAFSEDRKKWVVEINELESKIVDLEASLSERGAVFQKALEERDARITELKKRSYSEEATVLDIMAKPDDYLRVWVKGAIQQLVDQRERLEILESKSSSLDPIASHDFLQAANLALESKLAELEHLAKHSKEYQKFGNQAADEVKRLMIKLAEMEANLKNSQAVASIHLKEVVELGDLLDAEKSKNGKLVEVLKDAKLCLFCFVEGSTLLPMSDHKEVLKRIDQALEEANRIQSDTKRLRSNKTKSLNVVDELKSKLFF